METPTKITSSWPILSKFSRLEPSDAPTEVDEWALLSDMDDTENKIKQNRS